MRFANYGRKSVYSDRSDSIDNQFRMCREYCDLRFSGQIESWVQYSDEDFSGANTERPDLTRLLSDVEAGAVDALVVYQLDRLSRDVRDFSNIYSTLEDHGVMFISIKENIDTTTPIGRAMMYVTVVFAQMERETIAARVTDNMLGLAKKGYWTGGQAPLGYRSVRRSINGRKHVVLELDPNAADYVRRLFDAFLSGRGSIASAVTDFRQEGVLAPNGKPFSAGRLWRMLTSPYAAAATPEVYDYYAAHGCQMDPDSPRDQWDGSRGVMVYGRRSEKTGASKVAPMKSWTVCLGMHAPILSADQWLAVQARLAQNKFEKKKKYDVALLKGTLRCKCGRLMVIDHHQLKGRVYHAYCCPRRIHEGAQACDCSQVRCQILDEKVLDVFRRISVDESAVYQYVESAAPAAAPVIDYKKQIADLERQLGRLAASIAGSEDSGAAKYIVAEMEKLDLNLQALKREQAAALADQRRADQAAAGIDEKVAAVTRLIRDFDSFSADERNAIVHSVLKECAWDGSTLFLRF